MGIRIVNRQHLHRLGNALAEGGDPVGAHGNGVQLIGAAHSRSSWSRQLLNDDVHQLVGEDLVDRAVSARERRPLMQVDVPDIVLSLAVEPEPETGKPTLISGKQEVGRFDGPAIPHVKELLHESKQAQEAPRESPLEKRDMLGSLLVVDIDRKAVLHVAGGGEHHQERWSRRVRQRARLGTQQQQCGHEGRHRCHNNHTRRQ